MKYGLMSGCLWALDTTILAIALSMAPFIDTVEAIAFASIASAALHDVFCAIWMFIYMGVRGRLKDTVAALKTRSGKVVMLGALLGGPIGMSGYVIAINNIGPAYTAMISAFYPAFGALMAMLFLKEKMQLKQFIALLVALGGIFIMGCLLYTSAVGWQTVSGKQYYFDAEGKMFTGEHAIDGKPCFFDASGAFIGNGTPIMGVAKTNAATMTNAFVRQLALMGKSYPSDVLGAGGAPDPATFCKIIYEEATAEGVRPEVVWAQVMWETGWLQMGGDVKLSQYNFAGLGATGNGVAGAGFPDVRTGIRAQVQHLKCYASTDELNNEKVDPRWSNSLRGKAKLVEWLGIPENPFGTGWAASAEYGYNLRGLMKDKLGI